jgi:hypothetical protein
LALTKQINSDRKNGCALFASGYFQREVSKKWVCYMLHPNQFQVNETWIIFQLNDAPVITDRDGDFNVFALMDAASCFILDTGSIPVESNEISEIAARQILKNGYSHKNQFSKELIIPKSYVANNLAAEAERCGISVKYIPENQLQLIIGEAREGFQEHISKGRIQ